MTNKASLLSFLTIIVLVVLGCSRLSELSNDKIKTDDKGSGSFALAGKEWKSYDLENTDIKVELPGTPSDKTPALPPNYKAIFSAMRIYSYDEKDFASSYTELLPTGTRKFQIKELAETNMAAVKKQLPDLTYTVDITSETNAKLTGSFTKNGKSYDLRGCCIYKKTNPEHVWAVLTLFPKDNADAQKASQRIIDSAVFKDSSEVCK